MNVIFKYLKAYHNKMKTRLRVGVVLIEEAKVLVVRMHREEGEDIYVFPGGGVDENEGIFEAAIREVKEETNLNLEIVKILYLKDLYSDNDRAVEIVMLGKIKGGSLAKGRDPEDKGKNILKDIGFIDIKDIEKLNFHPKQIKDILYSDFKKNFSEDTKYLGRFKYPE